MAVKAAPTSHFEKMKMRWKGPPKKVFDTPDDDASYASFADMLSEQQVSFNRGEVVNGVVVQYEQRGLLVDIGSKASAYLPLREAGLVPCDDIESLFNIDDTREFMVISDENEMGQVTLSVRRLEFEKAWERVETMHKNDAVFDAEVMAVNKGGAIVSVEGLRAFLPGSHLCGGVPSDDLVGQKLPFKFLEVNAETNKLVVSNRRAVLEQEMKELSRGDVVEGYIKAIKPYGAFVEIRGMSGLLHISQISYDRIEDLSAIVQVGMKVKCMIIDHDKVAGRIALSTKTLEPEPGDMLKNPQKVFDQAEDTAARYHERMEAERKAREEAAKCIVLGLGDGLDSFDSDVLQNIADGIESVLTPEQK
jgi:small subunit ribosomal protein S1